MTYDQTWQSVANRIAWDGTGLSEENLNSIVDNLSFSKMRPEYLPNSDLSAGFKEKREMTLFLAEKLWGKTPDQWLEMERQWLAEAQNLSGITEDDGKDKILDIVSADILIRIFAVAYFFYETKTQMTGMEFVAGYAARISALRALNSFLENAVSKGQQRVRRIKSENGRTLSHYTVLKNAGVASGATGKYLPYPEKSLAVLLKMLHKKAISPKAYK